MTARANILRSFFECHHWLCAQVLRHTCPILWHNEIHGIHNKHHKVSQSVPFFMHCKTVTILLKIKVSGHFVMCITENHGSHYVTVLDNPHLFLNRNVCQISMRFEEANCAWNWFPEFRLWRFGRNCCRWTGFIWSLLVTQVVTYIPWYALRHCFYCLFHTSF